VYMCVGLVVRSKSTGTVGAVDVSFLIHTATVYTEYGVSLVVTDDP
jgi:hypothetical protein